ncbi:Por secretion system C-terminal sorting domain-containing protein [Soonwooa buanensis]|uniref:Por secretion system C-terminal sorting domain-containing protein n=1 Tax=Soonwooa buanensis TaxID=619805 RepID=A0A1T5CH63_9FLAO|nr:choice-of-anchor I family protein [Soonwooa buanensis]SKB58797.1 Por secretion system C-terminal sorting domain-containing protein [Soonwooa buanensis]
MKKHYVLAKLLMTAVTLPMIGKAQNLVHYWNFNNNSTEATIKTPTYTVGGATLTNVNTANSLIDFAGGTGQNFNTENLNARNNDPSGTHLRFNNPIGGSLVFALPTINYKNNVVKFTTRRSGSGAGTQTWFYSTDGTNYTQFSTVAPQDGNPQLITLDFSNIQEVNNNPNFKLKVEFAKGPGGEVGNNRFDNFTLDAITMGGADTTAPTVSILPANNATNISTNFQPVISFNENVRNIDNSPITAASAQNLVELKETDASGAAIPFTTTFVDNKISIIPTSALKTNQKYYVALKANVIEDESDNAVTSISTTSFTTGSSSISFDKNFQKVKEDEGQVSIKLKVTNPTTSSIDLVLKPNSFNTANQNDFTFQSQRVDITPNQTDYIINIPIIDDNEKEQEAEYFVLGLENANGIQITGEATNTVYIIDNDNPIAQPNKQIELNYLLSFDPSGTNNSSTEIVVHDKATQRLFTISALSDVFDIIDFSNPTTPNVIKTVDMKSYGGITSIAVKNGILAVASPNANPQLNGSVVFFDINGNFLKQVEVGALPDMVTFTHDGTKILTANEGEPNNDYSVDPEGSISIIDISNGIANLTQNQVKTLGFTQYNSQETQLLASGIRKVKSTSTLSQDFEPEYISISEDSKKAFVSLQENNAIVEVDLSTLEISKLWPLGKKDMSLPGNGFDASDNNGEILIANWPVKSYYTPDAIQTYNINGTNYIVTANEGDERDLSGFSERTTVGANNYALDTDIFPNASVLKLSHNLGRFRTTSVNGNLDSDAAYEEINSMGARSFSIFNADTQSLVFDSGDHFERYTAQYKPELFNSDNESNSPKSRSRAKGPEPEGVTLAKIGNETFAFITLERTGGVMVYNISNPQAPQFVDYKNPRSSSAFAGDNGPEGITFIPAENTTTGKAYVIVANEISGTLSIYEVLNTATLDNNEISKSKTFVAFPNPVTKGQTMYFNRKADFKIYNMSGQLVKEGQSALTVDTTNFATGVYVLKTNEGDVTRFIVK